MRSVGDILDLVKLSSKEGLLNDLKWKAIFVDFFVDDNENLESDDDLLFFVSRPITRQEKVNLQVRRKFASNLPLESPWINWEESLYLNLILQKLQYSILFSICTRTSGQHYQILSKTIVPVYATPSYHSVVYKESIEEYSYPLINFNIENFEDFIYGSMINDLEYIYVELIVNVSSDKEPIVLHTASVSYQSIDEAYCNKKLFNNQSYKYFGVFRVESIESEGTAEIVVKKKIKRSLSDSSNASNILGLDKDLSEASLPLYLLNLNQPRLMSQKCYSSTSLLSKGYDRDNVYKVQSENYFSAFSNSSPSDSILDKFWREPGFTQAYYEWKSRQKQHSNSFHCFVSNISIPWNHIINQLIANNKRRSIFIH